MVTEPISRISMIFFLLSLSRSSAAFNRGNNADCHRNVSHQEFHVISREGVDWKWWPPFVKRRTKTEHEVHTVWRKKCCPGYEEKNGICEPQSQCPSPCKNGYCHQSYFCVCHHGWGGKVCDEPLFCFITQPDGVELTNDGSEYPARKNVEHPAVNPLNRWKGFSKCHSKCLDQLHNITVETDRWGNETYHFVPIDSPCNCSFTRWKKFGYVMGVIMGIFILSVTIISTAIYFARKKSMTRKMIKRVPSESEYDYVDAEQFHQSYASNHFMASIFAPSVQRS